ncbi:hypothetical protein ACHAXA_002733 [Cyclostephanos tholiformis]|uniref:Uncharacterized protein n=1 Tax=Cyclostephanos tholiformis TaxID=382380 RepID=A0ABD3REG5_9STRA
MDGSRAVIGILPGSKTATDANDDAVVDAAVGAGGVASKGEESSVMKYELGTTEWRGMATRMVDDRQTLIDASIYIEECNVELPPTAETKDDDVADNITSKTRIVMTFGKLLIEDDGWDTYDLPIYEIGNNYFLYARGKYGVSSGGGSSSGGGGGGDGELGYHTARAMFVKDFDEDVTDVSSSPLLVVNAPTPSPTGLVERYFCTWDENKPLRADEYCNEARHPIWSDAVDECDCNDDDGGDGPFCLSVSCLTVPPTITPTVSVEPTSTPTTSPIPTFAPTTEPTAEPTTLEPTTSTPSVMPIRPSGGLSFNVPTDAGEVITKSIPLSPFVVDFSLVKVEGPLRRSLRREDESSSSSSSSTVARDVELLSIVSDHLLNRFEVRLGVEPVGVELIVLDKREKDDATVSYFYAGYAVYRSNGGIPKTAVLDAEIIRAFNNPPGKAACMDALHSSDDAYISGMTNVVASLRGANGAVVGEGGGWDPSPDAAQDVYGNESAAFAVEDPIDDKGGGGAWSTAGMVLAVLLATSFVVAGILAVRKYRRYSRNNANNDHVDYKSRKQSGKRSDGAAGSPTTKISVDGRVLKIKRYFNFESPKDGRSLAGADEEGDNRHMLYDDLEIVGGDTFPASQDLSIDGNPTTVPPGQRFDRQGKQFYPSDADASQPYDEESTTIGKGSPIGTTTRDMIYFSHIAKQMTEDELDGSHATVDDLYSDKDSYFQSCIGGGGPDKDSIQSLRSHDTLDNTFGFANESIEHLIEGIECILEKRDKEENAASSPSGSGSKNIDSLDVVQTHLPPIVDTSMSKTTTTDHGRHHIGDVVAGENVGYDELPVLGATPRGYEEVLTTRLSRALYDSGRSPDMMSSLDKSCDTIGQKGEAFEFLKDTPTFDSSDVAYESAVNTSDISTTDELFARIAELESKILNTESQLAQEESIKISSLMAEKEDSNSRTPLMTNAKSSKNESSRNETALASSAMQIIFSDATLAMMEQRRLECTPPPSEGDIDSAMIQEAKDNALLGKYLDESDSEEESTIFVLPDESQEN